ncbi:MAG: TolC family protein [Flavobacteriaceae bacterium]
MKKILSFLIYLSIFITYAQVKQYTLEECVMIALEKNISIQQSELDLEGADIDKADAFGNFLPRINAQSQHIWNNGLSQNITNGVN